MEGATRVDPFNLTRHFCASEIRQKVAQLSGRDISELFPDILSDHVEMGSEHILVECQLKSGLPLIVHVPLSFYRGVGARFVLSNLTGNPVICLLELVHEDSNLTIPLLASTDLEDAAIDWLGWSQKYDLPMLHWPLDADGYRPVCSAESRSGFVIAPQKPRRHHSNFANRRPRFLVRRKSGTGETMPRFEGREIIARD